MSRGVPIWYRVQSTEATSPLCLVPATPPQPVAGVLDFVRVAQKGTLLAAHGHLGGGDAVLG